MAISWTKTSGFFPPGVGIVIDSTTSTAYIRGNPTRIGTYNFTITATDVDNSTTSKDYVINVVPKLSKIGEYTNQPQLPTGTTDVPYLFTQKIGAQDIGVASESTFTLSTISGQLPPGITAVIQNAPLQPSDQVGSYDFAWINFSGTPTTVGTYSFTLRVTSATRTLDYNFIIPIQSPSVLPPPSESVSYTLTSNKNTANEGDTITFTLQTTGIPNGTTIPYTISGVSASDIVGGSLTGNFVMSTVITREPIYAERDVLINNNTETATRSVIVAYQEVATTIATATITVAADLTTEGQETLTLTLNGVSPTTSRSVLIYDTSIAAPVPTYALTTSADSVIEDNSFTITLSTTNVSDGTIFPYTITGVSSAQISSAALSGNFVISGGVASRTYKATKDTLAGAKTFKLTVASLNLSVNVTINDPAPTYALTTSAEPDETGIPTVPEPNIFIPTSSVTFTLTTTTVADNTLFPYEITGITTADIGGASLTGNLKVVNNVAAVTFSITGDNSTEGLETMVFKIPSLNRQITVRVLDLSLSAAYGLEVVGPLGTSLNSTTGIYEGESFIVKISGFNVPPDTKVSYSITGIPQSMCVEPLTGTVTLINGGYLGYIKYLTFNTINDGAIGTSTVTVSAGGKSVSFPLYSPAPPPANDVPPDSGGGGSGGGTGTGSGPAPGDFGDLYDSSRELSEF